MKSKDKERIIKNIKTIRHYLELSKGEFAEKTGIGKRAIEFENGRFRPTESELQKISSLCEISLHHIKHSILQTSINIY